jgi:hypothetical protein
MFCHHNALCSALLISWVLYAHEVTSAWSRISQVCAEGRASGFWLVIGLVGACRPGGLPWRVQKPSSGFSIFSSIRISPNSPIPPVIITPKTLTVLPSRKT